MRRPTCAFQSQLPTEDLNPKTILSPADSSSSQLDNDVAGSFEKHLAGFRDEQPKTFSSEETKMNCRFAVGLPLQQQCAHQQQR